MKSNASLKFCFGAMGCGKTRKLQGDYYSKIEDGFEVIIVKPKIDTKGDNNVIARDGSSISVEALINNNDNIYFMIVSYILDNNLDFLLVDEAQFLSSEQVDQLTEVVDKLGINVICYGLRTDFRGYLFDGSKRLFEVSDELEMVMRQCSCGKNKIFNMRLEDGIGVFDGSQIAIDGVDATYKSMCRGCYKNEKIKTLKKIKVR